MSPITSPIMHLVRPALPGNGPMVSRLLEALIDVAGLHDVLHELAILVTDVVPGCDGACFTLDGDEEDPVLVASDLWPLAAERARVWSDFGPCLRPSRVGGAGGAGRAVRGAVAAASTRPLPILQITASLCMPVPVTSNGSGCLHLYSCGQTRWPAYAVRAAHTVAAYAGEAVEIACRDKGLLTGPTPASGGEPVQNNDSR